MNQLVKLFVLFLVLPFYTFCGGQSQRNSSKDNIKPETKEPITSYWPGDTAIQIRKGSNGTILIATARGVFRYDGKSFTNLASKPGLLRFFDVLEDRKGGLWFATYDSGVYFYPLASPGEGEKSLPTGQPGFQHFTAREGLADNRVICLYEDKAGIIWFGTADGVSHYDGKSFRNFSMKGKNDRNLSMKGDYWWDNFITAFMEDKTGKLWIATRTFISIYDGKTFTPLPNKTITDVWSMIEDKKGNIWLGGWDGLRRYDGKTFTGFGQNKGYSFIIEDKKGNIWTSGIDGSAWALSRYDQKSLYDKEPAVTKIMSGPPGTFSGILEAEDGSIWFGNNGGLYRYDGKTITDFRSKEGEQ